MFGKKYLPNRTEDESWWQYYKKPQQGIGVDKFDAVDKGFSLGAGALIATKDDEGKAFSSNVFMMLGLPGVFLISGQAAILKERVGFQSDDPPFSALLAISNESVMANFGVDYKAPADGNSVGAIASVKGEAELAFFFNNASGWYINIGKDSPDTQRIQARILSLFDMYAYVMLSAKGINFGAGAKWDFNKKLGPVALRACAYLDLAAKIGFKPGMVGGAIALGGGVKLVVFNFAFGFDIAAMLAAEAWRPFIVTGMFKLSVKIPIKRKPLEVEAEFTWIFNINKDLTPFAIIDITGGKIPGKASHMLTEETFDTYVIQETSSGVPTGWETAVANFKVPMDSFIDAEFSQSVKNATNEDPNSGLFKVYGNVQGVRSVTMSPPIKGKSSQVKHESEIQELRILYYNGSSWETYFPYKFVKDLPNVSGFTTDLDKVPSAYWQMVSEGQNKRLRILGQNMLSAYQKQIKGTLSLESLGFKGGIITCEPEALQPVCVNWEHESDNTTYGKNIPIYLDGVRVTPMGGDVVVKTQSNNFSLTKGLEFQDAETLELVLPEPCTQVNPKISTTGSNKMIISYYGKIVTGQDHNGFDIENYSLLQSDEVQGSALDSYSGYDDINNPIEKISINVVVDATPQTTNTNDLLIGQQAFSSPTAWRYRNDFAVDDLRIFGRDLDRNEIHNLYMGLDVNKGLIHANSMDGNINDSSSQGNTTSYNTGSPTYTRDRNNVSSKAIYFNESNYQQTTSGHIKVNHSVLLSLDEESYAISVWFKASPMDDWWDKGRTVYRFHPILHKSNSSWLNGYGLYVISYPHTDYRQQMFGVYFMKHDGTKTDLLHGITAKNFQNPSNIYAAMYGHILDGDWHHIVVRCNHKTQTMELYIDDNLQDKDKPITSYQQVSHNAYLHQLCYLTRQKHVFNLSIPAQTDINTETQKMQEAMKYAIQPVWRPNTMFFVEIKSNDKVDGGNNIAYTKIGFVTGGPTGHFHEDNATYLSLKNEKREDEYALATLKPYINYDVSYPNPDGQMNMAKPLFYETPKLKLFFNDGYAYALFNEWKDNNGNLIYNTNLKVSVKDPEDVSGVNALQGSWVEKDKVTQQGNDAIMLNNVIVNGILNGYNCSNLQGDIDRKSYYAEFELPNLKPSKLYTSIYEANNWVSGQDNLKQVHHHVFSTSRYTDFEEQITSFNLGDDNGTPLKALITREYDLDSGKLTLADTVINTPQNCTEDFHKEFPLLLDKLMDGALQLPSLNDASTTEVSIIKDSNTSKVIGLLIRNPEPLIDPRIDVSSLSQPPIAVSIDPGNSPVNLDRFVYSKDKSKVFITNQLLDLPAGAVSIVLKLPEFDGLTYVFIQPEVTINFNF